MKRTVMLVAAALALGGCSWFEDQTPRQARLSLHGGEPGKPVRLIVSTEFLSGINDRGGTTVSIVEADTLIITLPYEQEFNIEANQRFFVETARIGTDMEGVQMVVRIDDRKLFDDTATLLSTRPLRFVYTFNQPITREIEVL